MPDVPTLGYLGNSFRTEGYLSHMGQQQYDEQQAQSQSDKKVERMEARLDGHDCSCGFEAIDSDATPFQFSAR